MGDTLASRVAQAILNDYILEGRLRAGAPLPRLCELEQQYGASIATVAHALGQLQALGWVVKGKGRRAFVAERSGIAAGSNQSVGLILNYREGVLPMRFYEGIEEVCRAEGFYVTVASTRSMLYADERETVQRMLETGCQAIVMHPAIRTETELATDYLIDEFRDIPIVLLDMAWPQQRRSQVLLDNFGAGLAMTQQLIAEGHRRIAFMTVGRAENLMWRSNMERREGYLTALRRAKIQANAALEWNLNLYENDLEHCCLFLERWRALRKKDRPSAILALEDNYAGLLIGEAREMGIAVPEDLVVVGFDNTIDRPPIRDGFLTTAPDFVAAGAKAAEIAFRHLRGEIQEPECYVLPAPVIRRTVRRGEGSIAHAVS